MRNAHLSLVTGSAKNTQASWPRFLVMAVLVVILSFMFVQLRGQYGVFASTQAPETAVAEKAGIFARMSELEIASIERQGAELTITMADGTDRTAHVCAWNDEVVTRGGCGIWTSRTGRYYKLSAGDRPSYRGAPYEADESAEYVLSWMRQDLNKAADLVVSLRDERSRSSAAAVSWKN